MINHNWITKNEIRWKDLNNIGLKYLTTVNRITERNRKIAKRLLFNCNFSGSLSADSVFDEFDVEVVVVDVIVVVVVVFDVSLNHKLKD